VTGYIAQQTYGDLRLKIYDFSGVLALFALRQRAAGALFPADGKGFYSGLKPLPEKT